MIETDKGESIYRSPEYAAVVIAISIFIYLVFRDAASIISGEKFVKE